MNRDLKRSAAAAALLGAAATAGKLGWDRLHEGDKVKREREFRLHDDETVGDGIRRIARGRIDTAIEALEQGFTGRGEDTTATAVHDARKDVKRLRATIRLLRPAIGSDRARAESASLRDAARRLAGARDSEVALGLLDELTERYGDELAGSDLSGLRTTLEIERERANERLRDDPRTIGLFVEALAAQRERIAGWEIGSANDGHELAAVRPGLRRIYARGRRDFQAAMHDGTDEALHEWRKRVKDLRHAAEILDGRSQKSLRPVVKRAKRLGDLLGTDHDLGLLAQRARPIGIDALAGVIDRRRTELQDEAARLGAKLYRRKPRAFARRV